MEQLLIEIQKLSLELAIIKRKLEEYENARNFDGWISRKALMEFLNYGDTQMASLFKSGELEVAEIGIRKFIKKESFIKFLEKRVRK
ncbi:hypothetical protein [Ferruginibacter albus]|uniref:hypothetical protein n=1 Tax=Ferruginibacter albus TaxID=2875540 RepID=UPI001CC4ADAA|nr:hypothetical protein [Ferruginibacter albus]UAY53212.1 hypothetical protein K9M53_05955 [Ferruginibacter albus]